MGRRVGRRGTYISATSVLTSPASAPLVILNPELDKETRLNINVRNIVSNVVQME
jgi:hypothetical protein